MRIQYENGTVICPQRKNVVANDSSFCKFCGDKLPKIDFEKYEWCPECAELVEKGLKNAVTADSYYIQFQRIWSSVPNAVTRPARAPSGNLQGAGVAQGTCPPDWHCPCPGWVKFLLGCSCLGSDSTF